MAKRILHVTGGLVGGGAETQLKLLALGLDRDGWQTGIVYLKDDPDFTDRGGIESIRIKRGAKWDLFGLNSRICHAIRAFKPDIVHTWLPEVMTVPAALYARRHGIPCLSAQRRSLRHGDFSLTGKLRDRMIPLTHKLATHVVCNFSYDLEPDWARKAIEQKDGVVIRNGLRLVQTKTPQKPAWLKDDAFKIIYVGRLIESKRVNLLVSAVAKLKEEGHKLQLAIYGQGPQEAPLRAQAKTLGLEEGATIAFMGYQPDWQKQAPYYDLFALPTLAEGMPNVLVEAMGQGLPSLSTEIFEISSFVEHGKHAWLVKPDCVDAFTDALRKLITEPTLRANLAANGKQLAESFSEENMIAAYETLYRRMLANTAKN